MFKKNNDVILKTLLITILMICPSSFFCYTWYFIKIHYLRKIRKYQMVSSC